MSFTSKATSEILVAGYQNTMLVIDTNKGEIVKRVCVPWPPSSDAYGLSGAHPLTLCVSAY